MSPSRPFIQRPVATGLLMLAIVLAGLVGFRLLPLDHVTNGRSTGTGDQGDSFRKPRQRSLALRSK